MRCKINDPSPKAFFSVARRWLLAGCFCMLPLLSPGQQPPAPFDEYQFYLTEPAIEILDFRYNPDCSPANGRISEGGHVIFIKSYREGSHVYLKYLKADGTVGELVRSRCYIDPVVPAL